jgi:hypothetical protein
MASIGDDFNRAALGAAYTQILTGVAGGSDLEIVSDRVQASVAATAAAAHLNSFPLGNDQWASVRITSTFFGGAIVRSSGTALAGTWNNYEAYASTATNIRIAKHVNNAPTTLINFAYPVTSGSIIRIEAFGSILRVFLNGAFVGQVIDTSHVAGAIGLITHNGVNGPLDDFQGGDLELLPPAGWETQYAVSGGRSSVMVPSGMGA